MKTIYIRGGDKASPGVRALKHHLQERGHQVVRDRNEPHDRIMCWGVSTRELANPKPALNGNVNLYNKMTALERFADKDIPVPTLLGPRTALTNRRLFNQTKPWFGRKSFHEKGNDITLCQEWGDVKNALAKQVAEYFSVFIPHTEELRVWTFKDEAFAIYHKQYKKPGFDNYKNLEFRSELRDDLLREKPLCQYAIDATKALKMDWGAVDILHGTDGEYYVLEVNSMPDISSLERTSGVRLAKLVSTWAEGR
jgi:hypothetical protein